MVNNLKHIKKAIQLEITKPQIQITLNKTELNNLINEALENPETAASLKRVIAPLLTGSFPQFPEFTNVSLGETTEEGTIVTLKMPRQTNKSDTPVSMEPLEVNEPATDTEAESQPYVDPDEESASADDSDVTGD